MGIIIVFKHNTNLSTLDKIMCMFKWIYKQKYKRTFKRLYKIWTHDSYSLKSFVNFLLVLVVTSYTEMFKNFKKKNIRKF